MSEPQSPPSKPDVARALLARGHLFLHLDPRVTDVRVPEFLRRQPQLVLQVGFDMPVPVPDLRVEREGLGATLSFQRTPFPCWVPWRAVFALLDEAGQGVIWPESLPAEIASEVSAEMDRSGRAKEPAPALPPRARPRSRTARTPDPATSAATPESTKASAQPPGPKSRGRARRSAEPVPLATAASEPSPPSAPRKASVPRPRATTAERPAAPAPAPAAGAGLRAVPGGRAGDAVSRPRTGERPSYLRVVK